MVFQPTLHLLLIFMPRLQTVFAMALPMALRAVRSNGTSRLSAFSLSSYWKNSHITRKGLHTRFLSTSASTLTDAVTGDDDDSASLAARPVKEYDVLIIGSGGGGKIAIGAAKAGLRVAMCEHGFDVFGEHKDGMGGTCLNRGCIPSKMLIHAADVVREIEEASKFSITASVSDINFRELTTRVEQSIDAESDSILPIYEKAWNRDLYASTARFVGPKRVRVSDPSVDHDITAKLIFIAGGCVPSLPPIPGMHADMPYLTSTEALRLKNQPKKMIVVGAGFIATELGHFYASLGTEVHFIARSKLIKDVDGEVREEFKRLFEMGSNINVYEGATMTQLQYAPDAQQPFNADGEPQGEYTLNITQEDGKDSVITADSLLVAAGVRIVSKELQLEKTGVEVESKKGERLVVDEFLRTTCKDVYGLGDMAGNYFFRHSANLEAEYLLEHVVLPYAEEKEQMGDGGNDNIDSGNVNNSDMSHVANDSDVTGVTSTPSYEPLDYTGMPWAIFASPQVAGVGMSEEDIQRRDNEIHAQASVTSSVLSSSYVKGVQNYKNSAMGDALLPDGGLVKLLIEKGSRKILGCTIVGREASIMIHQVIPLFPLGGRLDDLLCMVHIHPALNEIVRNAARKAGQALLDAGEDLPLKLRTKL